MVKVQRLKFNMASSDQTEQGFIETLRKAGVYGGPTDAIGGVIKHRKPGFEYKWLNFTSAVDMQRKLAQGYEIVYSPWVERKCKCVKDSTALNGCVTCKGTGTERFPDPKAEITPHHCEDGAHRWGDIILSRVKTDVYDAWKGLPVIRANKAIHGTREKTLGKFREAGVEAGPEPEDGIV